MSYRVFLVLLLWMSALLARAEQLRIAVAPPEIAADGVEASRVAQGFADLWQTLLSLELARRDFFAVVERADLPRLIQERELAILRPSAKDSLPAPSWLAADCLVIATGVLTNQQLRLTVRLIDAGSGAVEGEWAEEFPPPALEGRVGELASSLHRAGLALLSRRNIHTLVSVLDFECLSPFERSRWLETTLARRLRGALQRQPGVLVLEREEVDALFDEVRLKRGGVTSGSGWETNAWANVRDYLVVSGRFGESQPEGQPLSFAIEARVENLANGGLVRLESAFPVGSMEAGLAGLEQQVVSRIPRTGPGVTWSAGSEPDRAAEALTLAGKAVGLLGLRDLASLAFIDTFAWQIPPHAFSEAGHPFDGSPQRRTAVLRAVRYLKSAQMLDPGNARIKVFLSSLLADRSVEDRELAAELGEEVGWREPRFQRQAWWFLLQQATGERRRDYQNRLVADYPGTWEARQALLGAMTDIVHRQSGVPVRSGDIEAFRALLDRLLTWGGENEGGVEPLFQLTQITGRNPENRQKGYELRDPVTRDQGARVLEEMVRKYPRHAFYLSYHWLSAWDGYTDWQEVIDSWIGRTSDAALATDRNPWVIGVRVDPWRLQLARRLLDQGRAQEALGYLELVSNYHSVGAAAFLIGECAFALGDFERALRQFQAFDADHREAAKYSEAARAWVERCRAKLGLAVSAPVIPAYSTRVAAWKWQTAPFLLPAGTVRALASDGATLWVGVAHDAFWKPDNVVDLESDPGRMASALKQGGLVRVDLRSGRVSAFEVGQGISHPWVMCLSLADGRVWVGTYGKGIDVFDPQAGHWVNLGERDGLPSNHVQCMDADEDSLWVGTGRFGRGGVARFRFRTREWQGYLPADFPGVPPPTEPVRCLKRVGRRLWCAMPKSIYCYDLDSNRWSHWPDANHFTSIAAGADRVWFGADQFDPPGPRCGIRHCNLQGDDWQTLAQVDGLPDIAITSMAEDAGRLLLGSYGFMILDPAGKSFTTCDLRTETSKCSYVVSSVLAANGRLWMARRGENRLHYLEWPVR